MDVWHRVFVRSVAAAAAAAFRLALERALIGLHSCRATGTAPIRTESCRGTARQWCGVHSVGSVGVVYAMFSVLKD